MKTAYGRLAVLAAFALAGVAVLVPAAPAIPVEPTAPAEPRAADPDEEREAPQSVFAGTAIGAVLEANGNEVPKNGEQMMKVLEKFGEVAQLPVAFSAVALHSGLTNPRVILTPRPSLNQQGAPVKPGLKPADPDDPLALLGLPTGFVGGFGAAPTPATLSAGKLTRPNLEGRLFLAANMEKKGGQLKVKTFEFISWNGRKQRFDFGFIECDEVEPQIRVVDGVKCFSCHKNKGPILGQGPWSNTPHNDVLRAAIHGALAPAPKGGGVLPPAQRFPFGFDGDLGQPRRLDTGFISRGGPKGTGRGATFDGMAVLLPQGPAVDAAVRQGAELARDRDVYRAMVRTNDGRKGLAVLLGAVAAPGQLEFNNMQVRTALDQAFAPNYATFADKWVAIHKNSSSTLGDFNPAGSAGVLRQVTTGSAGGWGGGSTLQTDLRIVWTGDATQVTEYDAKRADGDHGLPSGRQPSNPKAFVRPPVPLPGKPSAAVNAVGLARLIGLTEADRAFLADQLGTAAQQANKPKVTAASLAKDVFGGPQFAEVLTAGEIPDREDFKDRFVKGLNAALQAQGAAPVALVRADYASGPNVARAPGKEENEAPVIATTACVRCHDVRGPGKAAFSPIPMLAFDPFDKASRETWAKATPDAKKRLPLLARMAKRLTDDRDMPPEDSAEYDAFRVKNPAEFDAVKEWLDAELKKAKGG